MAKSPCPERILLFAPLPCPLDLVVYTRDEFAPLAKSPNTIAHRAETTGVELFVRQRSA